MSLEQKSELGCIKTTEQPDWGEGHVRSVDRLQRGRTYLFYTITIGPFGLDRTLSRSFITTGLTKKVKVEELPKYDKQTIHATVDNGIKTDPADLSLAELGLAPYPDGTWSRWDWLKDPLAIQSKHTQVSRSLILLRKI